MRHFPLYTACLSFSFLSSIWPDYCFSRWAAVLYCRLSTKWCAAIFQTDHSNFRQFYLNPRVCGFFRFPLFKLNRILTLKMLIWFFFLNSSICEQKLNLQIIPFIVLYPPEYIWLAYYRRLNVKVGRRRWSVVGGKCKHMSAYADIKCKRLWKTISYFLKAEKIVERIVSQKLKWCIW